MPRAATGWRALGLAIFFLAAAPAPAQPAPERVNLCESCHGPNGNSVAPMVPSIAGQPLTFIENTLVYFREGLRSAAVMPGIVKGMKDEEITQLARHFSRQKAVVVATSPADPALVETGRRIAAQRHCGQCHMPQYQGQGQMARLAGQREDYLYDAMVGYRDGKRSAADTTMTEVLAGLSDAQLRAMAHFMAHAAD